MDDFEDSILLKIVGAIFVVLVVIAGTYFYLITNYESVSIEEAQKASKLSEYLVNNKGDYSDCILIMDEDPKLFALRGYSAEEIITKKVYSSNGIEINRNKLSEILHAKAVRDCDSVIATYERNYEVYYGLFLKLEHPRTLMDAWIDSPNTYVPEYTNPFESLNPDDITKIPVNVIPVTEQEAKEMISSWKNSPGSFDR